MDNIVVGASLLADVRKRICFDSAFHSQGDTSVYVRLNQTHDLCVLVQVCWGDSFELGFQIGLWLEGFDDHFDLDAAIGGGDVRAVHIAHFKTPISDKDDVVLQIREI